ncbi:transposase, partial [Microbacterium sp. ZW T5_45]|uniref:transposase n=1 Tax=Microbacterium sp. ZW T5_45 TaxID=3378080 RepID=UPI0038546723
WGDPVLVESCSRVILMNERDRPRARRAGEHYSMEERSAAVKLVRSSAGRTIREVAAELGIAHQTLYRWVAHARDAEIDPAGTMSDAARRRVRELEAENERLRRELDFQVKAQAFMRQISNRQSGSK